MRTVALSFRKKLEIPGQAQTTKALREVDERATQDVIRVGTVLAARGIVIQSWSSDWQKRMDDADTYEVIGLIMIETDHRRRTIQDLCPPDVYVRVHELTPWTEVQ